MLYWNIINACAELKIRKQPVKKRKTRKICSNHYRFCAFLFLRFYFIIPCLQRTYWLRQQNPPSSMFRLDACRLSLQAAAILHTARW